MDYPYIRVWHQMTGSYQYYIDHLVELARAEQAPENAIYKDTMTGQWRTIDDMKDKRTRDSVQQRVERLLGGCTDDL